jgi:drug/metabolite transporter (DMT)-like permease
MTPLALLLVLAAACLHAVWNLLAKRASAGGAPFVWSFGVAAALLWSPLAAWIVVTRAPPLGAEAVALLAASGTLHTLYLVVLQRGYRVGDLSLVYPLARGTAPLLSTAAAVAALGERPTPLALAGALLVAAGVLSLAVGKPKPGSTRRAAVGYALLTGAIVAVFTLWDKRMVSGLALPPLLVDWCSNLVRVTLLAPAALRQRETVRRLWRENRREILGVATIGPLSYVLFLSALALAPVSYVAPAREASILVAALLGSHVLAEEQARRRVLAAAAMTAGLAALALG